jgi:sugar phosphate isomerase/epimerase
MKPTLTRRSFLQQAAIVPVAAAAGLLSAQRLEAAESTAAPATSIDARTRATFGSRLKVSLNAFSFDALLRENLKDSSKGMSLFDVLDFCAQQNVDAIDPTGYYFPGYPTVPTDKYVNEFKRRAFELGLEISGTGIRNDFAASDPTTRAADIERAKQWIEVAARLGAPVLRVFAGAVPPAPQTWEEGAKRIADALHVCVQHGEKFGVVVGLQNHGDMLRNADECLNVLARVPSRWTGLILDTGNMLTEDPYADIARVIPMTVNWQIKELLGGNQGPQTDLPKLVRLIRTANYRGYLPIETLSIKGQPYNARARVTEMLGRLRAALAESA